MSNAVATKTSSFDFDPAAPVVIDLGAIAKRNEGFAIAAKSELNKLLDDLANNVPRFPQEVSGILQNAGMSVSDAEAKVSTIRKAIALRSEKTRLIEERKGRDGAIHAKMALEKEIKRREDQNALEMRDAERLIMSFDQMGSRLREIDTELKLLAPLHFHDAVRVAENALTPAVQANHSAAENLRDLEFRRYHLDKFLTDPKHHLPHGRFREMTRHEAVKELEQVERRLELAKPAQIAAEKQLAAAEKAFSDAKAALLAG